MKHGAANLHTYEWVLKESFQNQASIGQKWVPARPLGLQGRQLRWRLKCAYWAFIGKYDLLKWPEGQ